MSPNDPKNIFEQLSLTQIKEKLRCLRSLTGGQKQSYQTFFWHFLITKMKSLKNFTISKNLKNICKFSKFCGEFNVTIYKFQL